MLSDSMAVGQIQKFCLKILLWTVLILIATGINDRMLLISWPATKLTKKISAICAAPSALISFHTPNPGLTAGPSHFRPFGPHLQMYKLQRPG